MKTFFELFAFILSISNEDEQQELIGAWNELNELVSEAPKQNEG